MGTSSAVGTFGRYIFHRSARCMLQTQDGTSVLHRFNGTTNVWMVFENVGEFGQMGTLRLVKRMSIAQAPKTRLVAKAGG